MTALAFVVVPVMAVAADISLFGTAMDVSLSGFGTIGYTVSDQKFNYQRFIDNKGTLRRDSIFGAQVDVKLNNEFSVTVQGKVAPSMDSDTGVDPALTWAFLSWRPTNDWLIRAGRIRAPFYLNSQNMEIGATYDFARMPWEVYNAAQTNDGDGLMVRKSWNVDDNEFAVDAYFATAESSYRYYVRDSIPVAGLQSGSHFGKLKYTGGGISLSLQRGDDRYRMGVAKGTVRSNDMASPVTYPFVTLGPGVGYYQTTNLLPGPGVPSVQETRVMMYSAGADVGIGYDFRVMGEYVLCNTSNTDTSPSFQSAYLAVLRPIDKWVPYVSLAGIRSLQKNRDLYNKVNNTTVPGIIPNAAVINAAQRAGADGIYAYDQYTVALGTSYQINPHHKVKAEWARTQTGDMSSAIDAQPGGESGHKVINVFSFSYNFVF